MRRTESSLQFLREGQFLNGKPGLILPYNSLAECYVERRLLNPSWLVLRTTGNRHYIFSLRKPGGEGHDREATIAANQLIDSRIRAGRTGADSKNH